MKAKIGDLVAALRHADIAVSVAEAMDAARAAALVRLERPVLREALAATLVKDERDRSVFLAAFDAAFPARPADVARRAARTRRRGAEPGGEGGRGGGASADAGTGALGGRTSDAGSDERQRRGLPQSERDHDDGTAASVAGDARDAESAAVAAEGAERDPDRRSGRASAAHLRLDRERRLRMLPFRAMTPADVEACGTLARALAARVTARMRRRLQPRPTGRLDFRRTIRAAVPRGGVPFERRWRGRRPGAPDLVALVDLSASSATATTFFLSLVAPAAAYFRHVRLFGFVDRLVEIEFVAGQVRPAAAIDLMARSDFGRVLGDLAGEERALLGADTVLLVLGDARNNRRPPRADLLAAARARVRRMLWLNPDPRERWNTGDSVIAAYAKHVDAVVACGNLTELERALTAVSKV